MATYLWHEIEAAFDAAHDVDDSGNFSASAANGFTNKVLTMQPIP